MRSRARERGVPRDALVVRIVLALGLTVGTLVVASPDAWAPVRTANFDTLASGTAVTTQYAGLTFIGTPTGSPTAFSPASVTTSSPPRALHTSAACTGLACTNQAYKLVMNFSPPARQVSLRAGLADEGNNGEFPVCGLLRAFDTVGTELVNTGDIQIAADFAGKVPITTAFSVLEPTGQPRITRAVFVVGDELASPCDTNNPKRVNVDDITWETATSVTGQTTTTSPRRAPTVRLDTPLADQRFLHPEDAVASGAVSTDGMVQAFCVHVSATPETRMPPECTRNDGVRPDGTFRLPVQGLAQGANIVHAWVRDVSGRTAVASRRVFLDLVAGTDSRVDAIEITQAVQRRDIPLSSEGASVPYRGVRLVARRSTYVRVFADAPSTRRAGEPIRSVQATLVGRRVRRDGTSEDLSRVLLPLNGRRDLAPASNTQIEEARRLDENGAYVFRLPASWTCGSNDCGVLELTAEVNPRGIPPTVPEPTEVRANNVFTVTGIGFQDTGTLEISPIRVEWTDASGRYWSPSPYPWLTRLFHNVYAMLPIADDDLNVRLWWHGVVDVTWVREITSDANVANFLAWSAVAGFQFFPGAPGVPIGVNTGPPGTNQLARGIALPFATLEFPPHIRIVALTHDARPRTSVVHELMHTQGFSHAGNNCPNVGFPVIEWPGDDQGRLDSVGFDITQPGRRGGTYKIYGGTNWYDVMSYCGSVDESGYAGGDHWISALNWDRWGEGFPFIGRAAEAAPTPLATDAPRARGALGATLAPGAATAPAGSPSAGPGLLVIAAVDTAGRVTMLSVQPVPELTSPGEPVELPVDPSSTPYELVTLDAAGNVVSSTSVSGVPALDTGGLTVVGPAVVPVEGATSLQLRRDGVVLSTVERSPNAPSVRVRSPRRGQTVGASKRVVVRWRAEDADGDDLHSTVELSLDGGTTWRTITTVQAGTKVPLPSTFFPRSARARVRVTVSDGWNETSDTSGVFRTRGTRPQVTIVNPAGAIAMAAEGTLGLSGLAAGDTGELLGGEHLTWKDGRHVVGHGTSATLYGLVPGRHVLRLVAEDDAGRKGSARVVVRVKGPAPGFVGLEVPESIDRSARVLELRSGSTYPAALLVGKQRVALDREVRPVQVKVKRGSEPLRLRLRLTAGGKTRTRRVAVERD